MALALKRSVKRIILHVLALRLPDRFDMKTFVANFSANVGLEPKTPRFRVSC